MIEFVRRVINADIIYSGSGMLFALYLVMLFLLIFSYNDLRIGKSIAFPSSVFLIVIYILIPLIRQEISDEITRFFWLLLTPVVTSIGFTTLICGIEKKRKRIISLILIFPIVLICGSFQITSYRFQPVENAYRLPQAAVDIVEKVLSETEEPTLIVPYTIAHPFRQISTDVYLLYGEDATFGRILHSSDEYKNLANQMEMSIPDLNIISVAMEKHDCDYIVFDTVYTELCDNGNINVHGYPPDPNYVGDRTPTISYDDLPGICVVGTNDEPYWDLSKYNLEYDGTFGQYILYRLIK